MTLAVEQSTLRWYADASEVSEIRWAVTWSVIELYRALAGIEFTDEF
ncbi:MAG: hypothetical protein ACTS5I_00425 [Rhodanobacter sp.]